MNMSSIKRPATVIPVALSIGSLICLLTTSAKVPIHVTLTTPNVKIMVEINPGKPPSHFNLLQDASGIMIASDGE